MTKFEINVKKQNIILKTLFTSVVYFFISLIICSFYRQQITISFQVWISFMFFLVPIVQTILFGPYHVYFIKIEDDDLIIKWKKFNKCYELNCTIFEVDVEIKPFLKRTYKMVIQSSVKNDKHFKIHQLSNKEWDYKKMKELEDLIRSANGLPKNY